MALKMRNYEVLYGITAYYKAHHMGLRNIGKSKLHKIFPKCHIRLGIIRKAK
jgi:hypothetical protein